VIAGLRIEPATLDDLPELAELLFELFSQEADFIPNRETEMRGLRLLLEQPSRGRIFVLRGPGTRAWVPACWITLWISPRRRTSCVLRS